LKIPYLDSTEIIKTDSNFSEAKVDVELTTKLLKNAIKNGENKYVMGGFIASDIHNNITTLGEGGDDCTAALVASILNAEITIWKEVSSLEAADTKIVPTIVEVGQISSKFLEV
jgi:aspartokinase/homoserine dehydrogenase 1